ncbi:Uncharacterized protein DAT39_006995 [Clarias magur]|uniref:Uncharacterized protein n=1 Tax=Clarias magur TaxID=1594786 RepID=A0A8J4UPC0_CLAMG|nr:Uncharacterized protein DAT39_006995 [Clarias magur]
MVSVLVDEFYPVELTGHFWKAEAALRSAVRSIKCRSRCKWRTLRGNIRVVPV